ncbi:Putative DNA-binding domain-containing protein [Salinimicrobium sediminis]|uniref:DNA-binding domain-containing protein n=1 Tax=Salinimicrobium sediminis TaxID=1343891 RepID=A0A285X1K5_9FLAO|nr:ATP-binding protein [Salinimicrobium sediminis]SOC79202.1 Putative DNA-binding domain-containing protein [Salinimicrobium sediminis]
MINKRLLIKNLLAHNSENSFYDKKRQINLSEKEGKAKFLKHICALANSNPVNNSYMVIGVEDADNEIKGVDFFDDSKIQNLVNAYLENPPLVAYENIPFPHLPDDLVVGLVTIQPNKGRTCSLKKGIWKYPAGSIFFREGSISIASEYGRAVQGENHEAVASIEAHSQNNIGLTLDGVFDFMKKHENLNPTYKVFKEYFVVCWSGKKKETKENAFFSRVDIELINEQVKLFYSELDEVSIEISEDLFSILEYVRLGVNDRFRYYPLEEVKIFFKDNATYEIKTNVLFEPPQYEKKTLFHIYNTNEALINKLKNGLKLTPSEEKDLFNLPATYLLCYFNGFTEALEKLEEAKEELKKYNSKIYQQYKDSLRILRKVKYN